MNPNKPKDNKQKMFRFNFYWMYGIIFLLLIALYMTNDSTGSKEIGWTEFQKLAKENVFDKMVVYNKKNVVEATVKSDKIGIVFPGEKMTDSLSPKVYIKIPSADKFSDFYDNAVSDDKIDTQVSFEEGDDAMWSFLISFGPIILFVLVWIFLMKRMSGGAGGGPGGVFSVGKAKAQLFDKDNNPQVTFKDVAGLAGAKQEVEEIVSFLKNPSKYTELGGKIPKGALLVGPPGTGKTLLAKAVAGEANVPFFSLSGSDFVEMFVGVGASRVRDLFRQAKEKAPCIVFIDEIDAVNERKEIFGVHLRPIKIDDSVDAELLARQTPGFSGADIANVCNEAALIAARNNKKFVQKEDFMNAVDRIVGGLEKRTTVMTETERKRIAIHEAGHATISWKLEHANPLVKVTIVPRGKALGAAWYLPEERPITTREEMLDEMCSTLGGRAAEELYSGQISNGASNDLERVTKQAYAMVVYYGMSDKLPNINYYDSSGQEWGFTKPYSESTARIIDEEVQQIISEQYERAKKILAENAEGHNELANVLLEREVIYREDVEHIFGKRPWASRSEEILEKENKDDKNDKKNVKEEAPVSETSEEAPQTEEDKQ